MRQINAFERGKVLIECQSVAAGGGGAQGWAALRAADGRSTWASPRQGPAIWSPSGRPSRVNPQGTVIAGTPHDGEALGRQQPLDVARHGLSGDVGGKGELDREGRNRRRRRDDEVPPRGELAHPVRERGAQPLAAATSSMRARRQFPPRRSHEWGRGRA